MKLPRDISVLVSARELAEIVGIDVETVNNWLRHGIITRALVGGRQLRSRLFSTEEVYTAALKNELVKLGIPPSPPVKRSMPSGRNGIKRMLRRDGTFTD